MDYCIILIGPLILYFAGLEIETVVVIEVEVETEAGVELVGYNVALFEVD